MALAQDQIYVKRSREIGAFVAKNAEVIYAGALVAVDATSGEAENWADTAGLSFIGMAVRGVTGNSTSPRNEVEVSQAGEIIEDVSVTGVTGISDVGDLVYATDENTFTKTPTANVKAVGKITRHKTGTIVDVKLFTPEEYEAL